MATIKLLWHGRSFERRLLRQMTNAVRAAGEVYAHQIRAAIDTIGPPRSHGGEPPRVDHGDLLKSIVTVVSAAGSPSVASRTGSTSDHALPLELGTRNMAPRPFLLKTFFDSQSIVVIAMAEAVRP